MAGAPGGLTVQEAQPALDFVPDGDLEKVVPPPRPKNMDARAIAALIAIPAAIFAGAEIFGSNLLLSGDNLLQNYPLRVLVGNDLRHGSLPLWDPFIWSGTPLLAGLNSGAFYPTTLLFAVLSSHAAWVVGQIFVFSAIGVGTFLLFRSCGISTKASLLGTFSFTFAGAVASQTAVHIDMGEGLAALPWSLLAVRRLGDDPRWRWALLLGAAFALAILAGSPEAVLDTSVACATFGLLRWSSKNGTLWRYVSRVGIGGLLALGITAFLWAPALHLIGSSQRPVGGEFYASSFSFPPWSGLLGIVPYLDGGYKLFSQPPYFGQSNPEEVALYVGILPVIAVLTLWTRPWRQRMPAGELRCWYGLLIVGAVLAIAAGTPLEHILYHVPFYGRQRNSGRNIVEVDLAACALFAWWIDGGSRVGQIRERSAMSWMERALAFLPLAAVGTIAGFFIADPTEFWRVIGSVPPHVKGALGSGPSILLASGVAAAAALVALLRLRSRRITWIRWVSVFVLADIGLFSLGSAYLSSEAPPEAGHASSVLALVKANLSPAGRYAVFDPDLLNPEQFVTAGEPDVGILEGVPSFSGYSSLVNAQYADTTLTTIRGFLNIASLGEGKFNPVGLQVIVTVPESFLLPIGTMPTSATTLPVLAEQPGTDPILPGGNAPPAVPPLISLRPAPARTEITTGPGSRWWFGTTLSSDVAVLQLGQPSAGQLVRIGVLAGDESVRWGSPVRLGTGESTAQFSLAGESGEGLAVQVLNGAPLQSVRVAVATTAGRDYLVDGTLSNAVSPGQWSDVGTADDFVVFRAHFEPRATWLQAPATGRAHVVSSSTNSTTIRTNTTKQGLLVWSMGWDKGWHATLVGPGGDHSLAVERVGLVQGVVVPAGSSLVRFSYEPVDFPLGVAISLFTVAVLAIAGLAVLIARRRRLRTST